MTRMHFRFAPLAVTASLVLFAACGATRTDEVRTAHAPNVPLPSMAATEPINLPGLHNLVAYGDRLISGSQPEGDEGFETLEQMGVRTIISVDGGKPDVEAAKKHGIRYVHLPIGYDGIDEERKLELARAVKELPGPVYLHCHHGKHRSAGASATVALELGLLDNATATERMKISGTAPNYKGLWACAAETQPVSAAQLAKASNAFPSVYQTSGLVDGMVAIDVENENVKSVEKAGWAIPTDHPDMFPEKATTGLKRALNALVEDAEVKAKPQEFRDMLAASIRAATELDQARATGAGAEELSAKFKAVGQSCKACHTKYRD